MLFVDTSGWFAFFMPLDASHHASGHISSDLLNR
jgi:predicted nucleic acid-binding protein